MKNKRFNKAYNYDIDANIAMFEVIKKIRSLGYTLRTFRQIPSRELKEICGGNSAFEQIARLFEKALQGQSFYSELDVKTVSEWQGGNKYDSRHLQMFFNLGMIDEDEYRQIYSFLKKIENEVAKRNWRNNGQEEK